MRIEVQPAELEGVELAVAVRVTDDAGAELVAFNCAVEFARIVAGVEATLTVLGEAGTPLVTEAGPVTCTGRSYAEAIAVQLAAEALAGTVCATLLPPPAEEPPPEDAPEEAGDG